MKLINRHGRRIPETENTAHEIGARTHLCNRRSEKPLIRCSVFAALLIVPRSTGAFQPLNPAHEFAAMTSKVASRSELGFPFGHRRGKSAAP
jgi:hypothetical protein